MAKQLGTFISGKIGNVVFYERGGKYIARSMPAKMKLTENTLKRSGNFAIASRAGAALRALLKPVLPFPKDRQIQNKLVGAISNWLQLHDAASLPPDKNVPFVNGFSFNPATGFAERFKVPFEVDQNIPGNVEIQLPAFVPVTAIAAPANTIRVVLTITAASCDLVKGVGLGSQTATVHIPYDTGMRNAEVIQMPVPTPPGALAVVAASLTYELGNGKAMTNVAFMPSSVIGAIYC